MLNINNNAARIKREILARIAKLQLEGNLVEGVHNIPRDMAPRGAEPVRCCVYHDRQILRMRVIARLGLSLEQYDDEKTLAEYAEEALARESPTWPMLTVLDEACNACVRSYFMVTNACQGCVARSCKSNCPKKAIVIENGHARINEEKCVNCGFCLNNCPYHAIIKIPVPCEEACPVGAIAKDENGKQHIDYHRCIFCGKCMRECPFGAMMDKGQLVDVIKHILNGEKNGEKVAALYAPAVAAQFRAAPGQLEAALLAAGFSRVWEVAIGADMTADKEAVEFEERMERGDTMMTTSCCPAYVRAVRRHVPVLSPCISDTRSPMHYTAKIAKQADPGCVSVFIGPCLAKRREGMDDEFVDYVLSVEEIAALFIAKGIDVLKMEAVPVVNTVPTASGRNFARSGGVAESIRVRLKDPSRLKPAVINGLGKEGMKQLERYGAVQSGNIEKMADTPNLVEVMACEGGCIGGPSVITQPKTALVQLAQYAEKGRVYERVV
jgi:[FeFe] hydrogenase (group B1/B3)